MFTGIIEEVGTIQHIQTHHPITELTIQCQKIISDMQIGDSISVNGTCLTVTRFNSDSFTVQVIRGTENKTYLARLKVKDHVNLERALRPIDRLGGHFVQGHVDGRGVIKNIQTSQNEWIYTISADESLMAQMIPQGSIAVDGISLTIFKKLSNQFEIHLIPETRKATTLSTKKQGDQVHLETDLLFKYVASLTQQNSKLSVQDLLNAGF
ncbi:riboflavin synthase [Staphylococcus lutrae]|uniref:Riboflavin synthase n=1 Tax=Staphylococcus lutrae TaxID=155085 RepID=A0AAC9WIK4_9STAP|nr:riboflavin synthase [Staphylococcus lutrae]ARJ50055.1 riboflavin synthase [Staphylococcus lutrae]PNZ38373.1 riboflavin synthase subunit alpha [Staphylococcus lutrae]